MNGTRISLNEDHVRALGDALAYYELSDYGCGGIGKDELSEEQREHRCRMREVQRKVTAAYARITKS